MEKNTSLETEVRDKEKQKNKYCHHISKLENMCRDKDTEMEKLRKENQKLSQKIENLEEDMEKKLIEKTEIMKKMEAAFERMSEEFASQTSEYEHRIKDYEMVVTMYAKELKKPINMFVTGKSPFKESRSRNEPTPFQSTTLYDHRGVNVDVPRVMNQAMFEAVPLTHNCKSTDESQKENKHTKARVGAASSDKYGNKTDQDRKGQSKISGMTPRTTTLHPNTSRIKAASTETPLEGLQIVNTSNTKTVLPGSSVIHFSPRANLGHVKTARHMNPTKKN